MVERYVSTAKKVTPYEREILGILQEECAEIIVVVSKILRFGKEDHAPDDHTTNSTNLGLEIGDATCMMELMQLEGIVLQADVIKGVVRKQRRLEAYLQNRKEAENG